MARSTSRSQNVQSTPWSDHFWRFRCRFSRGRCKGFWTLSKVSKTCGFCSIFNYNRHRHYTHYTPIHYTTTTTTTTPSLHSTTLHSTTLHCTQLHSITLHYITLHSTPLHYITLHYTPLHYTTLPSTTLHFTTLHYNSLHYTTTTTAHSISRNDGRRGAFEEDLQRRISRGRCSTKDMFIRDFRGSGRSFPERGCILEYQILR